MTLLKRRTPRIQAARIMLDPRELALRHPVAAVAVFVLLWVFFGYANYAAPKGAILENALVNPQDPYRRSDDYVRSRIADGFRGQGEIIPFFLYFDIGIQNRRDLVRIAEFTKRAREALGTPVVSLSTYPNFTDRGDEIISPPYIPDPVPLDFDIDAWKKRVRRDPAVYGTLVGRDFAWATVVLFVAAGRDEISTFRRVVEFIEGRKIPWWEWLYKTDIRTPNNLGVGSHLVLDGLIDQGMNVDVFKLVALGIVLTFPVFVFAFRAVRPAVLALVVVVLSGIIWTRGSIGLAYLLGIPLKERVYCLLAYANCIVQGVSFALHKYECFYETKSELDRRSRWRLARSIDGLIAFTAIVSVLGFASLYWFQVLAIRESGVLSALGVVFILFNASVLLPAIDMLFAPARGIVAGEARAERSIRWLGRVASRVKPIHSVASIAVLWTLAVLLIWPGGYLEIWTSHLDFAEGTAVERTAAYVNASGRIGFDVLDFLVEPAAEGSIRDPQFLRRASEFVNRVRELEPTREVSTILNTVQRVSDELLGVPLPRTRSEAGAVFNIIEGGLERALVTKLYYGQGLRVSVHAALGRSDRLGRFLDDVLSLARTEHPELRVHSYGELSLYPQWDHYIRIGKPLNVLSSQWVVVILFMIRISWRNRRWHGVKTLSPILGGFIASTPFVFATAVLGLLLVGARIPLDAATAAITALAINAAIDFAVYLFDEYQEELAATGDSVEAIAHAISKKGRVILADMTLNSLCALPLVVSRFQPLRHVGYIMPVMLVACAVGTLVLMAALLPIAVRASPAGFAQGNAEPSTAA